MIRISQACACVMRLWLAGRTCPAYTAWQTIGAVLLLIGWGTNAATIDIGVFDYFFEPYEVQLATGDTVTWTAYGSDHTVISDNGVVDSFVKWATAIPVLGVFRFTFHEAGPYPYYCLEHGGPEGVGMSATIIVSGDPANQIPTRPTNLSPVEGERDPGLNVELRASAFSDPDAGDYHTSSQWIVRRNSDQRLIYDSGEVYENGGVSDSKTNRFLPTALLEYGTSYAWQVRYKDNYGAFGSYSLPTTFRTISPVLIATHRADKIELSWPTNTAGFFVEEAEAVGSATWSMVHLTPEIHGKTFVMVEGLTNSLRVYRLRKFEQ